MELKKDRIKHDIIREQQAVYFVMYVYSFIFTYIKTDQNLWDLVLTSTYIYNIQSILNHDRKKKQYSAISVSNGVVPKLLKDLFLAMKSNIVAAKELIDKPFWYQLALNWKSGFYDTSFLVLDIPKWKLSIKSSR